jgi:hypothetical protein
MKKLPIDELRALFSVDKLIVCEGRVASGTPCAYIRIIGLYAVKGVPVVLILELCEAIQAREATEVKAHTHSFSYD